MYENFAFPERDKQVTGYHFSCENPSHVLCLIHGIGEHAGRYQRMARILAEKGIAIVSMDLRGHGISGGVRGDTAPRREILADVDALIMRAKEFYPQLPITLYGHSMGGNIGLDYMMRGKNNHMPSKYIISAPWIKLVMAVPTPLLPVIRAAAKIAPKMTISQNIDESTLGNPDFVKPYKGDPDNGGAADKPFLLMHGDADKICDVEGSRALAKRLSQRENFTYVEWPGYCHEIHNGGKENTGEAVIEKIGQFIIE